VKTLGDLRAVTGLPRFPHQTTIELANLADFAVLALRELLPSSQVQR